MTRTQRTNPAYAFIAYRRAILKHISALLTRDYCSLPNEEPAKHMYSDEVFLCDREVPSEDIGLFIEDLEREDAKLLLDLNKFEFRAQESPAIAIPMVPAQCMAPPPKKETNEQAQQKGTPSPGGSTPPPSGKPGGKSGG
jgi:hypothetical protein